MKKSYLSVLMATVLTVSMLTGCGSKNENVSADANADALARIQQKGKITVAMEGTWAPWTYHDENDKLVGFDVEVAQQIADKLGVEAEFVEGEWDGLFAGLDSGRYDIVVNGVEVTEERSEKYDFSDAYGFIKTALIVKDDNEDIKTFEDLNGKVTTNSINSTYMLLAEKYKYINLVWHGGELLIAPLDYYQEIYDYCKKFDSKFIYINCFSSTPEFFNSSII